jgi:hypothetical protein
VLKILAGFAILFLVSYPIGAFLNWMDEKEVKTKYKPQHKNKWG